jgi:hypothetical protein
MNYIKRLEQENRELLAKVYAHEATVNDLRAYLLSDKFYFDPTVQVRDVLRRIEDGLHCYENEEIEK